MTVQELYDTIVSPEFSLEVARQLSASGMLPVANHSCPESCNICPRGDDVHRPPSAPQLLGEDWACEAGPPTSGALSAVGQTHTFHLTCPQTDPQIGGASENAAPWSHDIFAARQREWLEDALDTSTADWK